MRIVSTGHAVFAMMMVALGVQGLITGRFTAVWQPVPGNVPARQALAYLCAVVSLACGCGLLWPRTAVLAARVLLVYLLFWLLMFRVRAILYAPGDFQAWDGCAEMAVIVAAAWVLQAWFAADDAVPAARLLYGAALIPFGLAHFMYVKQTAALVPASLPAHLAWAYATGGAFLAAGIAVVINVWAQLATVLSALQIGLFTLLVWVPAVASGSANAFQWSEFAISSALTAGAWVVADSYRRTPTSTTTW